MGEAKKRGTFEERKLAAIVKQESEKKSDKIRKATIEANKTPEQKQAEKENKATMLQLAMLFGMAGVYRFPFKSR